VIRTLDLYCEYIPESERRRYARLQEVKRIPQGTLSKDHFVLILAADVRVDEYVDQPRTLLVLHKPDPFPAKTATIWYICNSEQREGRRKWANKVQTFLASYSMKGKKARKLVVQLQDFVRSGKALNPFIELPDNRVLAIKGYIPMPEEDPAQPQTAPTVPPGEQTATTLEEPAPVPQKVFGDAVEGPAETPESLFAYLEKRDAKDKEVAAKLATVTLGEADAPIRPKDILDAPGESHCT
jgi:hypothetical protein